MTIKPILTKEQFEQQSFAHWLRKGIIYDNYGNYGNYLNFVRAEYKSESMSTNTTETTVIPRRLYIWRSKDDNKVRDGHAEYDDKIFDWNNANMIKPGEDFGCRCYAEFIENDLDGGLKVGDKVNSDNERFVKKIGEVGRIDRLDMGKNSSGKNTWEKTEVSSDKLENLDTEKKKLQVLEEFINSDELGKNVEEAENQNVWLHPRKTYSWFTDKVTNDKEWNYKKKIPYGEHVGNFNYGATGRAVLKNVNKNIAEDILLRGAGWRQAQDGTSQEEWGDYLDSPFADSSYGDDPRDQEMIKKGIDWYEQNYNK